LRNFFIRTVICYLIRVKPAALFFGLAGATLLRGSGGIDHELEQQEICGCVYIFDVPCAAHTNFGC
jgi:hypothetical protein